MSTDVPKNQMFTSRQEHIIQLAAEGYTPLQIAEHLGITNQAVYKHARQICGLVCVPVHKWQRDAFSQLLEWIDTWYERED